MVAHDSVPRLIPLALAAFAGFAVWRFLRMQGERRLLGDTPQARVRSAPQGYVELRGTAGAPEQPLLSRLSATPCAWYSWKVERRESGVGERREDWVVVEQGSSTSQFWLDDGTGRCIVDPEGAEVRSRLRHVWGGDLLDMVSSRSPGPAATALPGHRYTEELILPGEALVALGQFTSLGALDGASEADEVRDLVVQWKSDPLQRKRFDADSDGQLDMAEFEQLRSAAQQQVRAEHLLHAGDAQTHVLRRPADGRTFLLCTLDPEQLERRLHWQAWAWLAAGCAALGVAGGLGLG